VGSEIPGTYAPGNVLEWILLLGAIYGALLAVLAATEKALDFSNTDKKVLRPYGGLIIPVGWAAWSVTLLWAEPKPWTVLIVLMGVMAITIAGQKLAQNCRA
jgi:hypothetical protein